MALKINTMVTKTILMIVVNFVTLKASAESELLLKKTGISLLNIQVKL